MSVSLHEKALECVKNYKRSEKELLNILSEMDRTKVYLSLGVSSLFRYCVEKLGLSESETYRLTQVTRKSVEVPALKSAIDQGLLTVAKASRIAAVINKENQEVWVQKALTLNHRQIEREVAKENPKGIRKDKIEVRTLERSELRITISRELESKFRRAQEVLKTKTLEETLEKMVDLALRQKDPVAKAERVRSNQATGRINVSNSKGTLGEGHRDHGYGTQLPRTCKGSGIGRPLRTPIPTRNRHETYLRYKDGCGFKGCGVKHWLQIHHIRPLPLGGTHDVENLMVLCSSHHKMMHEKR